MSPKRLRVVLSLLVCVFALNPLQMLFGGVQPAHENAPTTHENFAKKSSCRIHFLPRISRVSE